MVEQPHVMLNDVITCHSCVTGAFSSPFHPVLKRKNLILDLYSIQTQFILNSYSIYAQFSEPFFFFLFALPNLKSLSPTDINEAPLLLFHTFFCVFSIVLHTTGIIWLHLSVIPIEPWILRSQCDHNEKRFVAPPLFFSTGSYPAITWPSMNFPMMIYGNVEKKTQLLLFPIITSSSFFQIVYTKKIAHSSNLMLPCLFFSFFHETPKII